jgi:hypothetical protein
VAGLEKLDHLTTLDLSRNGLQSLAGLEKLNKLTTLYLSYTRLQGVAQLEKLGNLTTLVVKELFQLMVDGEFFLFAALLFKPEQIPFPGRIIVFNFEIHDSADPGESVGKDPEQSAIAEACVRGCLDRIEKPLK